MSAEEILANAEASVAAMVGASLSGAVTSTVATPTAAAPAVTLEGDKYEFDAEFQSKIMVHAMRNLDFMQKTSHLLKPEYFENAGEAVMVNMALLYYKKHATVPSKAVIGNEFRESLINKSIRREIAIPAKEAFTAAFEPAADLSDGNAIAEKVAEFAQHQAMTAAIYESVALLEKKQFDKINQKIKAASDVGLNVGGDEYDYFDRIAERTELRHDKAMGKLPPVGVTTGLLQIDNLLYHKGWGRRELSALLGGAKSGKTTGLISFGRAASLAGKNVLYVTLEVATPIISERLDASISDVEIRAIEKHINDIDGKIRSVAKRAGKMKIHQYASGTFTPAMLRALIGRYKSPAMMPDGTVREAVQFDLVVVDYADIMAPDVRTQDAIENSRQIWLGLRACAHDENVAVLTATQGNRVGATATVLGGTHVADDYNKVRTIDIMISINVTDEERANGEARLYFAASRNQESGITIFIKQNLAKMQFVTSIVRVE